MNISAGGSGRSRSGEPRVPAIMETLLRSMLMGSAAAIDDARRRAAIVVTPDTRGIGLLEFHQIDRAIEAGRAAGKAAKNVGKAERRRSSSPFRASQKSQLRFGTLAALEYHLRGGNHTATAC